MRFELLVATRYLKAKRKQAAISLITFISVLGVAAGVAALIIAMAVSAGLREDLQERLLGTDAHLWVLPRINTGIPDYEEVSAQIEQVEGVIAAAPCAYQGMMLTSRETLNYVLVKGIIPDLEERVSTLSKHIVAGAMSQLEGNTIVIGQELADSMGIRVGDSVTLTSAQIVITPFGKRPRDLDFRVVAIFSIGLYEYDMRLVYIPLAKAQYLLAVPDVATRIDVSIHEADEATAVGDRIIEKLGIGFDFQDWQTRHKSIFQALKLERLGMAIAIGLIVFVAALNIVATLTMMVLEKTRDIAALMAMGANRTQIRRIFIYQGVIIGVIGTALGVVGGHVISYLVDSYHLIQLDPLVYPLSYLPLKANIWDSLIIAAAAILISFLATLYPSGAASRLQPVEALRYE